MNFESYDPRFWHMKGMSMDNRSTLTAFIHCHTRALKFEKHHLVGFSKIERTGVTMNTSGQGTSVVHGHTFHMPNSGIITLKIQ